LIEVKKSNADISTSLQYYTDKQQPQESIQLVYHLDRAREKAGIKILPLGKWLENLS